MSDGARGGLAAARALRDGSAIVFRRNWSARASLARVIDATRLELTPQLHPLITRVESLREQGFSSECVLHELVPLGPLRIPNKYRAARRVLEASAVYARIELDAWASLGVHLRHELTLRAEGERTDVSHSVRVTAPRVLRAFVARTAQRAHDAWVQRVVGWAERERGEEAG